MEIIKTVPIYELPDWIIIMICAGFVIMVMVVAGLRDTKVVGPILGILSLIVLISGIILADMPASEFIEKYEVVKHFEYSDVFQIKKIENK